jgi:hypothetical protein
MINSNIAHLKGFLLLLITFSCFIACNQEKISEQERIIEVLTTENGNLYAEIKELKKTETIFEGTWESNKIKGLIHIFKNENLIIVVDETIIIGTFNYNDNTIFYKGEAMYDSSEWETLLNEIDFEYVFSKDNLIIVLNGVPDSLIKIK